MHLNMTPKLIHQIAEDLKDSKKAGKAQDVIEAIVAELKKDYRNYQRKHFSISAKATAHWESLISDVTDPEFWDKVDHLLNYFDFEY